MFGTILILAIPNFAIGMAFSLAPAGAAKPPEAKAEVGQLPLGNQPLYAVNETIEVTSDWANVVWQQGLQVVAERDQLLQGVIPPKFGYHVDGLSLYLGKNDTTTVVVQIEALVIKGNATATINVSQGAIGYTKVYLSGWNLPAQSFSELPPFPIQTTEGATCSVGWCAAFDVNLAPLYNFPSGTVNVQDAVKGMSKMVIAPLFPWYGNPAGPSKEWWHWGNPPGTGITNTTMVNTADYPLMGPYDSGDVNIIRAQMAMARYAGIDAFEYTWWGIGDFTDNQMKTILNVAQQADMKIMACFCTPPSDRTVDSAVNELVYLVRTYASYPAYYKDAGRPVFFVYAATGGPNGTLTPPSFWENVRSQVEAQVGRVLLVGDSSPGGEQANPAYSGVFDGFWTYTEVQQYLAGNIEQWYASTRQTMAIGLDSEQTTDQAFAAAYAGGQVNVDRKLYVYTVTPGNNNSKVAPPGVILSRENGTVYARQWNAAIDQNASTVFISSWNEWHEGAEIEPSLQYGFQYVDLTRQFSEEYKNTTLQSLDPRFSASVRGSDGELSMLLSAATDTPALMTKVEVKSVGATHPSISGNFTSYESFSNATFAEVQVPYVSLSSKVSLEVAFQPSGSTTNFEVRVSSYDSSGKSYSLFNGEVSSSVTTSTVTQTSTTSATTTATTTGLSTATTTITRTLTSTLATASTTGVGALTSLMPYLAVAAAILFTIGLIGYGMLRRQSRLNKGAGPAPR